MRFFIARYQKNKMLSKVNASLFMIERGFKEKTKQF